MVNEFVFVSLFYSSFGHRTAHSNSEGWIYNALVEAHEKSWFHLKPANAAQSPKTDVTEKCMMVNMQISAVDETV